MKPVEVLLTRLDPSMPVPAREHPGDAGWDLRTRVDVELAPGERALIATGIAIALPEGFVAFVHPRSGLALRTGFTLVNSPGTIDAGYRGEIKVIGMNTDAKEPIRLTRSDRIAQLLVQQVCEIRFTEVERLPESVRSAGGFGSSGTR